MTPSACKPPANGGEGQATGWVAKAPYVRAAAEGQRLLQQAQEKAELLMRDARERRAALVAEAHQQGLAEASAELANAWLALRKRELDLDRASLERSIDLARLLAERLLGESLRLDPDTVVSLAREALRQLWRAKRVDIHANATDLACLRRHVADLGLAEDAVQLVLDETQAPGCVRLSSDVGAVEAEITAQLDRLTCAVRRELLHE